MTRRRIVAGGLAGVVGAVCLAMLAAGSAPAARTDACPGPKIRTAAGCQSRAAAARGVQAVVKQFVQQNDLRAALLRIDLRNRTLARVAAGESMVGVPANLRMNLRIGSIAIPYEIDVLLQLQDAGKLSLDEPLSNWLPEIEGSDRITLRMLATATSGLNDWVQENPDFAATFYANVFRQWTSDELLDIALARPRICDPGQCFHYAHTNFIVLAKVIQKVTGKPLPKLLRKRVLRPLGLRHTVISGKPDIPPPVLHAYTSDRGVYEDSTFWSPSWSIAETMIMTSTIGDMIKSAKALGSGALISKAAARERLAPTTATLPPFSDTIYYGLGVIVDDQWLVQNPEMQGYTAIMAYLPSRRISLALTATKGQAAAATTTNFSEELFKSISEYLTPDRQVLFP